jgi:hypothetical protein
MRIVDFSEGLDLAAVGQLLPGCRVDTDIDRRILDIVAGVRDRGDAALFE